MPEFSSRSFHDWLLREIWISDSQFIREDFFFVVPLRGGKSICRAPTDPPPKTNSWYYLESSTPYYRWRHDWGRTLSRSKPRRFRSRSTHWLSCTGDSYGLRGCQRWSTRRICMNCCFPCIRNSGRRRLLRVLPWFWSTWGFCWGWGWSRSNQVFPYFWYSHTQKATW